MEKLKHNDIVRYSYIWENGKVEEFLAIYDKNIGKLRDIVSINGNSELEEISINDTWQSNSLKLIENLGNVSLESLKEQYPEWFV